MNETTPIKAEKIETTSAQHVESLIKKSDMAYNANEAEAYARAARQAAEALSNLAHVRKEYNIQ